GGFTLEAAESIGSGDGLAAPEVLGLLLQLVDRSMVISGERSGQSWYRLLETVRQYAWERLVETGEADEMRRRHLTWYLALAEQADGKLRGPEQQVWLARLEAEHDNLRAALEWGEKDRDEAENGLRLAAALFWFWQLHGHWSEGRRWLDATASFSEDPASDIPVKVLRYAALLAVMQGDYERAAALGQRGVTLSLESGDEDSLILCRSVLCQVAEHRGNLSLAVTLCEENLNLSRKREDEWLLAFSLTWVGWVAKDQGDFERSAAMHSEALALFRKAGDKNFTALALRNLGVVALRLGDHKQAAALCRESLMLSSEIGGTWQIEQGIMGLGGAAALKGQHERAAQLLAAAEALRKTLGRQRGAPDQADFDKRVASTRAALGETAFTAAWAQGSNMPLEDAIAEALGPAKPTDGEHPSLLTPREREVVGLIAQGLTNRDIASRLVISERTVDTHVQRILNKLGVNSRVQVAAWAVANRMQPSSSG
ncbi:MAG TPA: LuxR C-terminal-related transcriptional regulator, partial [Anaerolineales bacterium]